MPFEIHPFVVEMKFPLRKDSSMQVCFARPKYFYNLYIYCKAFQKTFKTIFSDVFVCCLHVMMFTCHVKIVRC